MVSHGTRLLLCRWHAEYLLNTDRCKTGRRKHGLAGASAGLATSLALHPLDVIKTRLQGVEAKIWHRAVWAWDCSLPPPAATACCRPCLLPACAVYYSDPLCFLSCRSARWRGDAAGVPWHPGCAAADCGWRGLAGALLGCGPGRRAGGLRLPPAPGDATQRLGSTCLLMGRAGWLRRHLRAAARRASCPPARHPSAGTPSELVCAWRNRAGLTPALAGSGIAWGVYFYAYNRAKQRYQRLQQRSASGSGGGRAGPAGGGSASQPPQRLGAGMHLLSAAEAGAVVRLGASVCCCVLLCAAGRCWALLGVAVRCCALLCAAVRCEPRLGATLPCSDAAALPDCPGGSGMAMHGPGAQRWG